MGHWGNIRGYLKNKIFKNVVLVSLGNIVLLVSKILVWLIVPKMLGVTEYGYYKTFTLYLVYTALLHFGFPDGILLTHGGEKYSELEKSDFRIYSRYFFLLEIINCLIILVFSLFFQGMQKYILLMISIDTLFVNITVYFKYISQAVMRFKELTKQNILQGILQIVTVIFLCFFKYILYIDINGRIYIATIVSIDGIIFLWYIVTYSDIIFGKCASFYLKLNNIKTYFKSGIILTFSYQVANLIYTLDAQMVSVLFDVQTYSLYAFSYTVVRLVINTIGTISTVLFPSLCEIGEKNALKKFSLIMGMVSILACGMFIIFFPMSCFISWYLPNYIESLDYLKIIMPGLALTCCINMVIFTYYKVIKQLERYMKISLVVLNIGLLLNIFGYILIKEPFVFSVASIITCCIWYILSVRYIVTKFYVFWKKNFFYLCVQIAAFYISVYLHKNLFIATLTYIFFYGMITFLFYKKELHDMLLK